MSDETAIKFLSATIKKIIAGEYIENLSPDIERSIESEELRDLLKDVFSFIPIHNEGFEFVRSISKGDLNHEFRSNDPIFSHVRELHSKLKHLVWQTQRLAEGDYSQQIDFLGDFSTSFNKLIDSLRKNKDTELALAESEKKYRMLTDNMHDVIWELDLQTLRFIFFSPSIFQLLGYYPEELIDREIDFVFVPSSFQKATDIWQKAAKARNNDIYIEERFQNIHRNGKIVDVEITAKSICDETGSPIKLVGSSRDITKRVKAEKSLAESEEKYRLIAENTYDTIVKANIKEMRFTYLSPSVYNLLGYTSDEMLDMSFTEIIAPISQKEFENLLITEVPKFRDKDYKICNRLNALSKDGKTVSMEICASILNDKQGSPTEIVGTIRDITERVAIENSLKQSEAKLAHLLEQQSVKNKILRERLEYVFNNSDSAIAFFDIDGPTIRFSACNRRWANGIGYEPWELENFDVSQMSDTKTAILYRESIELAIKSKQPTQEYMLWRDLYLHILVVPIIDNETHEIKSCGAFVYNISDKFETDLKIRETENRFFTIFNNSNDAILLMNMKFEIIETNEGFYKLYGSHLFPKNNLLENYVPLSGKKTIMGQMYRLKNGEAISTFECELHKHDRTILSVELSSSIIMLNQSPMILCIIRDISSRKNMQRMVTQISTQVENNERKKIANDIHDNIGPLLSSMNMYLSALSRRIEVQDQKHIISDIQEILKETITSVREISNNLSPQVLQNFGLTAALELFFQNKKSLINININNQLGDLRFSEVKETMIYSIIKEAFNNTMKHSQATDIDLKIDQNKDTISIVYSDNGIGFNLEEKLASSNGKLGLFSIINRIKNIDGSYQIATTPGNGFRLKISFPGQSRQSITEYSSFK